MTGDDESEVSLYPDLRDPRVMVAVPHDRRAAMTALWALAERLGKLVRDAREPLIAQIKLAWWRDMMATLENDPTALPKGEPLLAELQTDWAGKAGLGALPDAAEALLLADDGAVRSAAACDFGTALFALSGGGGGERWGLVWAATLQGEAEAAHRLFADARDRPRPSRAAVGHRALLMLDRWAGAIAAHGGERRWRREELLLFRIGLLGR